MVKCNTMAEVRREIDRLDRELVKLLAERQTYIEQAGIIKGERSAVRDEARLSIRAVTDSEVIVVESL